MNGKIVFADCVDGLMPELIDILDVVTNKGILLNQTFEALKETHPNLCSIKLSEFIQKREVFATTKPVKISEEDFGFALGCLPPMGYTNTGQSESFKMSERYLGRITTIYARVGDTFWAFRDLDDMSHSDIIKKINEAAYVYDSQ